MAKKKVNTKYKIVKADRLIRKMLEEHGKVRVVFADVRPTGPHFQEDDRNYRRRILTKDGKSKVSYKSCGYNKWTGYSNSCFVENAKEKPKDDKKLVKLMRKHDGSWLEPIEIHYGWFFRKKVKLEE